MSIATHVPTGHPATPARHRAAAVGVVMMTMLATVLPLADLTSKLHLSHGDAMAVLALLQAGSIGVLVAIYPVLAAVLGTLRLLLMVAGAGAVIGF
jgi:hypothetical protein